jgi:hypothetical protein
MAYVDQPITGAGRLKDRSQKRAGVRPEGRGMCCGLGVPAVDGLHRDVPDRPERRQNLPIQQLLVFLLPGSISKTGSLRQETPTSASDRTRFSRMRGRPRRGPGNSKTSSRRWHSDMTDIGLVATAPGQVSRARIGGTGRRANVTKTTCRQLERAQSVKMRCRGRCACCRLRVGDSVRCNGRTTM